MFVVDGYTEFRGNPVFEDEPRGSDDEDIGETCKSSCEDSSVMLTV